MTIPFYIVDVFAEQKYSGNQLAVFLEAENLSDTQMLTIAREINFAESTFVTAIDAQCNIVKVRIFTPQHEMQFAGHPIIGTSWIVMNKIVENKPKEITLLLPAGPVAVCQQKEMVWLQSAQPEFLKTYSTIDFLLFTNLLSDDFSKIFPIQEVSTGSAFVIIPITNKKVLEKLTLNLVKMDEWLKANCQTNHRAFYFFCLEDEMLSSRMFCIENNQLVEDAATGSASCCLQAYLLKYHATEIEIINHQGDFINRSSQIYFKGTVRDNYFDITIGGKTKYIAQGEWEV